jgi:hypothetical protein
MESRCYHKLGKENTVAYPLSRRHRLPDVRGPQVKNRCSSFCVQTNSEAHPASCPVGTADPFPDASSSVVKNE